MSIREIVLVLLIGNILSSPIRAVRHQYPYYAGIFKPVLAAELLFGVRPRLAVTAVVPHVPARHERRRNVLAVGLREDARQLHGHRAEDRAAAHRVEHALAQPQRLSG